MSSEIHLNRIPKERPLSPQGVKDGLVHRDLLRLALLGPWDHHHPPGEIHTRSCSRPRISPFRLERGTVRPSADLVRRALLPRQGLLDHHQMSQPFPKNAFAEECPRTDPILADGSLRPRPRPLLSSQSGLQSPDLRWLNGRDGGIVYAERHSPRVPSHAGNHPVDTRGRNLHLAIDCHHAAQV